MTGKYEHRYTIAAADMDQWYRLTPHAILLFYQDCFARYMTCHSLAAFDIVKEQKMWVITEYEAFRSDTEAFWSEDIFVTMWVSELTPLRVYCDFSIRKAETDVAIAWGSSCWNLLSLETKRLEPTTLLFERRLPIVPDMMTDTHKKKRFPKGETLVASIEHTVTRLDLDFNGHVNNRSYLNIAMLSTPDAVLAKQMLRHICIHWLRETYLGDVIRCELCCTDGPATEYVYTLRRADGCEVAQIYALWQPAAETEDIAKVLIRR